MALAAAPAAAAAADGRGEVGSRSGHWMAA